MRDPKVAPRSGDRLLNAEGHVYHVLEYDAGKVVYSVDFPDLIYAAMNPWYFSCHINQWVPHVAAATVTHTANAD